MTEHAAAPAVETIAQPAAPEAPAPAVGLVGRPPPTRGLVEVLGTADVGTRADVVHAMQRTVGNARVTRMLQPRASARGRLQRFEAPIHEAAERQGLTSTAGGGLDPSGLTNEEASAVYMGNWMRDVNQVLVPLVADIFPGGAGKDVAFNALALMATRKFGRLITSEQLGYYVPAEHIDSPAGLHDEHDVLLPGEAAPTTEAPVPGAEPRPAPYVTPQESLDPRAKVAGAADAGLFAVDQTGTMAYIRRTNDHIERRLELAARSGRNPEGMMHFGAALHAIEDLFSHSNWVEIAVDHVLAKDATLLASLKGGERKVFTFSQKQTVGKDRKGRKIDRPVLQTGSFIGADTKISLTSELTKFMAEPLRPAPTKAEDKAKQRFVLSLLQTMEAQLAADPEFRETIRQLVEQGGIPEPFASRIVNAPIADIYDLTRMPGLPDWVRDRMRPAQTAIDNWVSEHALRPGARRIQAEGLNAEVADTSLIKSLRDQQRRATQEVKDLPAVEQEFMRQKEELGFGPSVKDQNEAAQKSAADHVASLQQTPERVVAGPTHSQLGKDHPNSPFFGLAFHIAAEAVRRMRIKMVAAWDELAGGATSPFDFGTIGALDPKSKEQRYDDLLRQAIAKEREGFVGRNKPRALVERWAEQAASETMRKELAKEVGEDKADAALAAVKASRGQLAEMRELYAEGAAKRGEAADKSLAQANEIIAEGGEGPAYDVAAMRKANADAMRTAAAGLEGVAGTPEQSAEALAKLNQAIGRLDLRDERIAEAQEKIGGLEKAADEAAKGPSVEELRALSAELRALAGLVETTRAQPEREELNAKLVNLRNRMTKTLLNTPAAHRALAASVMVVINDQVAETRPSYTAEQRAVLEGRRDLREHEGPRGALPTTRYTPPDAAKAVDPAFKRTPALVALIKESRLLMGHPYENDWWMPLVRGHVRKHDKQLLADIEARNEGYATLRRPGESREGGH